MKTADIILEKLKREGAITAKKLSEDLSMTSMGARQHLQALQDSGLVEFFDVKVKVGRPTRNWKLTAEGHQQFSDRHSDLSVQVIEAVHSIYGEEGVQQVTLEREKATLQRYKKALTTSRTFESKLSKLAQLREQDGYMAETGQTEQGYLLIENHCPICKAATSCPALCQSELNVFRALFEENIEITRTEHIVNDERRCVYLFRHI